MKVINQLKMEFQSLPANVAFARVAVAAFASQLDFTLNDLEELKVAVSEAVANAIVHGYGSSPSAMVRLSATLTEQGIEIRVEDSGRGIADVRKAMEPAFSTDPERMGLGFVFMQSFMDRVQVDSSPGKGTRVTMFKQVNGGAPAASQGTH
ncbi:anti-sigma F factor [Desulfofundulus thermobenzoicus]|uniref:Anti-sigma F factor n=1 Tax=Desulfofundulus thermobenzoicus TaxID=29376 RepID=A0A6N7ITX4_9FIRM|nr:anti-sigma F factor [Desulfofundulus thermobenzoicus]MQL52969.1 anti-sigma F factor [Desulfofundulus thermobenzoicus]HHW42934.1 anti-sigma F factor [Desulfotomaculum sp.]